MGPEEHGGRAGGTGGRGRERPTSSGPAPAPAASLPPPCRNRPLTPLLFLFSCFLPRFPYYILLSQKAGSGVAASHGPLLSEAKTAHRAQRLPRLSPLPGHPPPDNAHPLITVKTTDGDQGR